MTEFKKAHHHLNCAYEIFKKNSSQNNSKNITKIQRTKEIQRITSLLMSIKEVVLDFNTKNKEENNEKPYVGNKRIKQTFISKYDT
tara:strand:- start:13 stop:270 length:258 start_codon:yes stop_codon:yes gene_type:complete